MRDVARLSGQTKNQTHAQTFAFPLLQTPLAVRAVGGEVVWCRIVGKEVGKEGISNDEQ